MALLGGTFFHCAHKPYTPVKHAELFASCRLRFLEIGQILILKVALALCVMQAAFFDAFARHALKYNYTFHLPKHFRLQCTHL